MTCRQYKYRMKLTIRKFMLQHCTHEITVKRINGKYHCRVFTNGELNQEAVCDTAQDINYTCRNLLRTEDKMGNWSSFASSARTRLNNMFKE